MRNAKTKQIEERAAVADAETSHVERITKAVRLEIRACTDRACEVVEDVRRRVASPPSLKIVKVPR